MECVCAGLCFLRPAGDSSGSREEKPPFRGQRAGHLRDPCSMGTQLCDPRIAFEPSPAGRFTRADTTLVTRFVMPTTSQVVSQPTLSFLPKCADSEAFGQRVCAPR